MKTLRFLMAALLLVVCGASIKAQVVKFPEIKIYKEGKVIASFLPAQVDSVVYEMNEVDMSVDRNIYSDAACTKVLFDASKVVVGKTSIAGERWDYYSQCVVTIPEGVTGLWMKQGFEAYCNNPLANTCMLAFTATQKASGNYKVAGVLSGEEFVILSKYIK